MSRDMMCAMRYAAQRRSRISIHNTNEAADDDIRFASELTWFILIISASREPLIAAAYIKKDGRL